MKLRSRSSMIVAGLAALVVLAAACTRSGPPGGDGGRGGTAGDQVAAMFLRNRDKLPPATEAIETSLSLDLAGFVTPLAGSGSNEVTLDFMVRNEEAGPALVIIGLVPYEVGNVVQGPGARFVPLESPSLVLNPGERKAVSVRALRERVPPPNLPGPQGGPAGPESPMAPGRPSFRLTQEMSPPPLFDPSLGIKVLVVVQEASLVDANVVSRIRAVPDGDFEREYGKFQRRDFQIPVPPQQIL